MEDSETKVILCFDFCSSSKILEDLSLTGSIDVFRSLLGVLRERLVALRPKFRYRMYKVVGDGWLLLFPDNGGEIYFADESSVRSDYHSGTTWAPKGMTPVVKSTGARFSINMFGAATARGKLRFRTFKGTMTAPVFINFLRGLQRDADKPVFVIVDGHPVHRSRAVREYVQSTEGALRLFFLPGYSPELNPIEQAWNHAKRHNVGTRIVKGPDQLRKLAISALRKLQKLPAVVMGFFRHPECAHAGI